MTEEPTDEERDGLGVVASRRRVVRWSAGIVAGVAALGGLAACGGEEEEDEEEEGEEEEDD